MQEATIQIGDVRFSVPKAVIARALFGDIGLAQPAETPPFANSLSPAIGEPHEGGIYAGLTLFNNQPHKLILLPGDEEMDWKAAVAFAEKKGAVLPSRMDGLVLFQNLRSQFKKAIYWTSEPYADDSSYAWGQSFNDGNQLLWHKDGKIRVRLVRRVPI